MTSLRPDSPTVRQTEAYERTEAIVVELHPKHLAIRLKGQRGRYLIDYRELLAIARRLPHASKASH
jgi:hypothetical protein